MSYVYIIASEMSGPVKIGISNNPQKRVKQLQTGNPHRLTLFHIEEVENAEVMEAEVHLLLRERRLTGEWFSIGVLEALDSLRVSIPLID